MGITQKPPVSGNEDVIKPAAIQFGYESCRDNMGKSE